MSPEQLHCIIPQHLNAKKMVNDDFEEMLNSKRSTLNQYVQHVLARNKFSVRKISISQSVPSDWRSKAEENAPRDQQSES